ncbi:unnamed protein product [Urochloa decumbens]|uniref:Ubiquitin-like protease family profile domain-containing protein n=1 Tax=Urochloa decumbens TaxID=240449 RepID=A0ABC8Z0I4_9POAL
MEKKSFSSNLKLGKFRSLIKNLTKEQKDLIRSCQFGSILDFDCSEAPMSVSFWLAKRFDVQTRTVNLQNGSSFALNPFTIHQILGIPLGGRKIPTRASKAAKDVIANDTGTGSVAPTVDQLFSLLNTGDVTGDKFLRIFMLIALAIFLCPTSYGSASAHYYSGIASVEDIPKYDWCSFVLDWLVTSIQKFQESAAKGNATGKDRTSSLGGCLFVLILKDPSETPFLVSSISSASFSRLPAQVEDFIVRLIPDDNQQVRKQLSDMCRSFYKDLMGSSLAAIQPVIIKQMCKMAKVMCDGLSMDNTRRGSVYINTSAQARTDVSIQTIRIATDNASREHRRPVDPNLDADTPADAAAHMPEKTMGVFHGDNVNVASPSSIQCAQKFRYNCPDSTSILDFNGVTQHNDEPGETVENEQNTILEDDSTMKSQSIAAKKLTSSTDATKAVNNPPQSGSSLRCDPQPGHVLGDNYDNPTIKVNDDITTRSSAACPDSMENEGNILGSPINNDGSDARALKNITKDPKTPPADCATGSQLYMDRVVPDSYDRSSIAVRKTATQLLYAADGREDVGSANDGPKKKRRLGLQNQSQQAAHLAPHVIVPPSPSIIDVASENNTSQTSSSSKEQSLTNSPATSVTNTSTNSEPDEGEVNVILSEKFTRRRAIRLPRALASPSVSLDIPRQKITVSKLETDLFHLATKRLGPKVKSKTIARIGRFHIDQRLFGDSLRPRKKVGTFLMNVFCEACNADYRENPQLKPSKCFLTSDAVDKLKSKKSTVEEIVEVLSNQTTGLLIGNFDMVFIPVCHSNHWWLIIANLRDHRFDILNSCEMDSTSSGITARICDMFRKLQHTMFPNSDIIDKKAFPMRVQPTPMQKTTYDCGIFVMKFLQIWDGRKIHDISQNDIVQHRKKIAAYILTHKFNEETIADVKKFIERDK